MNLHSPLIIDIAGTKLSKADKQRALDALTVVRSVEQIEGDIAAAQDRRAQALAQIGEALRANANDAAAHIMHMAKTDRQPYVLETLADE